MPLLDADQSDQSPVEQGARAGLACLVAAALVSASAAAIFSNLHTGPVGAALGASVQMAFVLLAAIAAWRWRMRQADLSETISIRAFVSAAAWLTPLAVLCFYRSWFSLPTAGAFAVLAVVAFRQLRRGEQHDELEPAAPFQATVRRQDARRALGIKFASCLAYVGVALGLTVSILPAALLVGAAAALIAWFQLPQGTRTESRVKTSTATALAVLILATMVPAASTYGFSGRYPRPADALNERGSGLHTGVVLVAAAKPESQLTAPPSPRRSDVAQLAHTVPLSIPFTGEYWIFYWPRRRPGEDASRVYGSPLTAAYRSTDNDSFVMEARQPLAAPIDTACCRAIDIVFDSADPRPENVLLELLLLGSSGPEPLPRSLGAMALPPSLTGEGALRFDTASAAGLPSFNEIVVRFHLEQPRQLHSARVAIKRFDLIP